MFIEDLPTVRWESSDHGRVDLSILKWPAMGPLYTSQQGQYLAFIYYFTKIHRQAPSEAEMQRYFQVSPPSVHRMVVTLERQGLIARTPGVARSIRLLVDRVQLPDLE